MLYKELIQLFLKMIQKIKSLNPAYKQPGDGSDGTCDCIGLVIGALKRMGIKWPGIHGSNYAARYQTENLRRITSVTDLDEGDLVYKACEKGSTKHKWDLPKRYHKGGAYYNGDLLDYYHVGVVTSINPLKIAPLKFNITHMTSPSMRVDTKLDQNKNSPWNYTGKCKLLLKQVGLPVSSSSDLIKEPVPTTGCEAIVVADSGSTVFMRQYPDRKCKTWVRIKIGEKVTILEPGEVWAKISYGRYKGWYMMAQYLDVIGDGKGKY